MGGTSQLPCHLGVGVTSRPGFVLKYGFVAAPQAAKVAERSLATTEIVIGENETRVSFAEWLVNESVEENSSVIVAVTSVGTVESEGAGGKAEEWRKTRTSKSCASTPI